MVKQYLHSQLKKLFNSKSKSIIGLKDMKIKSTNSLSAKIKNTSKPAQGIVQLNHLKLNQI